MSKSVAYLGPPGTYSQAAVLNHFGAACVQHACNSIDEVFAHVEQGKSDAGIVPVENSTEGVVNNTQDCFVDTSVSIVGEEVVSIEHHLLLPAVVESMDVEVIASHKQSLAQCRRWISETYPQATLLECASNAEAAKLVSAESGTAAIAGTLAAETYGLTIAHRGIQDQDHNSTRFLALGKDIPAASGSDKTSVLIYTANKPGALFRVLEPFEQLQISLTKIDSRPSKKEAWEYVFFIDFEGHRDDDNVKQLFVELEKCTEAIKVLGSYPAFACS